MIESGIYLIGLAFLVLALFPLFIYLFFQLVVLDLKSKALVDDLSDRGAFKLSYLSEQKKTADGVRRELKEHYGYRRFTWPVVLVVFFNLVGFSIVWDTVWHGFGPAEASSGVLYSAKFLAAAQLPMMAFLGVIIFNYGHLLRRLYVWDVTTHVFWNALYRSWLVVSVAVVLAASTAPTPEPNAVAGVLKWTQVHAFYFALGFIVNPVLQNLLESAQAHFNAKKKITPELPLSLVQGISFWHQYRLEEEGIDNVQNLATCNVIDLAVTTRYNLRTLLDWVDQAVLIHRMGEKAVTLRDKGFVSGAIDMAWASPENTQDDEAAKHIAKTVGSEPLYVANLMDSLFEDAQVRMLWDLWQSEEKSWDK